MDRLKKDALLISLAQMLLGKGSWCGETHIQKAVYWAQELKEVPFGFNFILYKHGPFSFDLRDEITSMRADGLLELKLNPSPYGPTLVASERGKELEKRLEAFVSGFRKKLAEVAEEVGAKKVSELERLATALYVSLQECPGGSVEERARVVLDFKPHISQDLVTEALVMVDRIRRG